MGESQVDVEYYRESDILYIKFKGSKVTETNF